MVADDPSARRRSAAPRRGARSGRRHRGACSASVDQHVGLDAEPDAARARRRRGSPRSRPHRASAARGASSPRGRARWRARARRRRVAALLQRREQRAIDLVQVGHLRAIIARAAVEPAHRCTVRRMQPIAHDPADGIYAATPDYIHALEVRDAVALAVRPGSIGPRRRRRAARGARGAARTGVADCARSSPPPEWASSTSCRVRATTATPARGASTGRPSAALVPRACRRGRSWQTPAIAAGETRRSRAYATSSQPHAPTRHRRSRLHRLDRRPAAGRPRRRRHRARLALPRPPRRGARGRGVRRGRPARPRRAGRARSTAASTASLHFAALSLVGESVEFPERYWRGNVVGALNLLDAMRAAGVAAAGVLLDRRDLRRARRRADHRGHAERAGQRVRQLEARRSTGCSPTRRAPTGWPRSRCATSTSRARAGRWARTTRPRRT